MTPRSSRRCAASRSRSSVFNILGYTLLGFEQPWLWPFIALATAYTVEIGLEIDRARVEGRTPRFLGNGPRGVVEFLYPAHITASR